MKIKEWRICYFDPDKETWFVLPEGPWPTRREALRFARAEVGMAWEVVPVAA
jgi:hypothetical protein